MSSPVVNTLAHDRRIAEALLEISYAVGSVMEIDDILQRICEIGARVMETDTCSIYLIDEDDPSWMTLVATKGLSRSQELGTRGFPVGKGIPGWAAANNQTLCVPNAHDDPRDDKLDDLAQELKYVAFLVTPLRIQDDVVGVMSLRRQQVQEWKDEEVVFAEIVAKQAAIVLEKARLYKQKVDAERLAAIAISLSEVAHYIKNIIASMSGGAYFVETGLKRGDLEKARSGWGLLKRSNEKIRNLVENMLLFSRQKQCELDEGDVNELIADLASEIEDTAFQRGIVFTVNLDPQLPHLMIDAFAFHDVLLNLVSNAMDAIPEGNEGLITVRTQLDKTAGRARIHISDNGMGIPPEAQKKLFDLFFTTKGRRGTGIGLAVTRKIVAEHHGEMTFTTEIGVGTTFTITLPVPEKK